MKINLNDQIKQIQQIQRKFNISKDPAERYALIQALNHIVEVQMPIHDWVEKQLREAMLRQQGVNIT